MFRRFCQLCCVYVLGFWTYGLVLADEPALPPGDLSPVLRLETGGPRSYTSGLEFSPDGTTLYAVGWDKAVQVWGRGATGKYEYSQAGSLRVPTGAGLYGGLNAMALSTDGIWLAVAGQGHCRDMSGERNVGWVLPAGVMSGASQFDEGLIYVFNTATREAKLLRGHRGPVQSLAFVTGNQSSPPELVSVAEERNDGSNELQPVIRYWDVSRGTEEAKMRLTPSADGKSWTPLPHLQGWRPGLAAWKTGPNVKQTRVAIAWGDDQFRIWNTQTGQVATAKSNPNVLTVLKLPGADEKLLTGSHAEIGVWNLPKRDASQLANMTRDQYQKAQVPSLQAQNLPSAAVLVSDAKNAQPMSAFVVTKYLAADQAEYRLVLTTTTSPIRVIKEVSLPWRGDVRIPAIAATRDGKTLAIAGNDDNSIVLYRVEDLVNGRDTSLQVLRSQGVNTRFAAFVRKEDRWGIAFSEEAAANSRSIPKNARILDIADRKIEEANDQWRPASAVAEGWSVDDSKPGALVVSRPQQAALTLPMEDYPAVTCHAVCPASKFCPVPLIAVGAHQRGQPLVRVYRGDTGELVRWCIGHTERLRSLAFSEDGRMLISSAADRTIGVWTVADLAERNLDRHGRLLGIIAHQVGNRVLISEAPADNPLQAGDELISTDNRGEVTSITSTRELYQAALDSRPGATLSLNIRRGGKAQTVTCNIVQAVDESKPLFSVFVSKDTRDGAWNWIGWNHLGNFDTSGDEAERLLGWHFNTGEAVHPAKFASIGDYRDGFYKRHLLNSLVEDQKLVLESTDEDPQVSFWLRDSDGSPFDTDYEDRPFVTSPNAQVIAKVDGVSERRIRDLSVVLDGAKPLPLTRNSDREWSIDLSKFPWKRGVYRVSLQLNTFDRQIASDKEVVYRPASPSIDWAPRWNQETLDETVMVSAEIQPTTEPIEVQVRIRKPGQDDPVVVKRFESAKRLRIEEAIAIEPGENQIEVIAFNASAPENQRTQESVKAAASIRRSLPPKAPRISLLDISILPESGSAVVLGADSTEIQSEWPKIRLQGKIECDRELDGANITLTSKQSPLAGFKPGKTGELPFDEVVTLTPGQQTLLIQANIGELKDEKRLSFNYLPPLPNLVSLVATAKTKQELPKQIRVEPNVFFAEYHEPTAVVTAVLNGRLDNPFRTIVKANDQTIAQDQIQIQRINANEQRLVANVPLTGGKTKISLGIENDWSSENKGQSLQVELRRPPEVLDVVANLDQESESAALAVRVRSVLPLRSAAVVIDDQETRRDFEIVANKDQADEWLVTSNRFGLSEGVHTLRVSATNDEGVSLAPVSQQVERKKKPTPPPVVAIHSPVQSDLSTDVAFTTKMNKLRLEYSVDSKTDSRVRLLVQGNAAKFEIFEKVISADQVKIDKSHVAEEIELFEGVNEIQLSADNDGGSGKRQVLRVAYVPDTATVEIVSIGEEKPRLKDGSAYLNHALSKSRITLRGKVRLPKGKTTGEIGARVWVNQFKLPTIPVKLDEQDQQLGRFETEITLSKMKQNEIRVEVFRAEGRVACELGSTESLIVDCDAPERDQELYVLLLGSGDGAELREQAREALLKPLGAKPITRQQGSQEVWDSPAFTRIHVHDAINATPAAVQHRLRELVGKMLRNLKGSKAGTQSIVWVYYQGQITMTKDDFAFGQVDAENALNRAITGRILEENLARSYGAHLIFLDLQQDSLELQDSDIWPKAPHLGIAVQNWKGKEGQPKVTRLSTIMSKAVAEARFVRNIAKSMNDQYAVLQQYRDKMEAIDKLSSLYDLRIGSLD